MTAAAYESSSGIAPGASARGADPELAQTSTAQSSIAPKVPPPNHRKQFATAPLSWERLAEIIGREELDLLRRSEAQEREYKARMVEIRRDWSSVYDYILWSKFGFERRRLVHPNATTPPDSSDSVAWEVHPSLDEYVAEDGPVVTRLCRNDFPYWFDDGIEHWIVWKLAGTVSTEDIDAARDKLRGIDVKLSVDFLHWVNPPHLKSLPGIDHVHILCRRWRRTEDRERNGACQQNI